ncbi:MAG TPA: NnrS family protein [Arenimonas sp.]|nr:NnrS family protein [Arenimonas sp.]
MDIRVLPPAPTALLGAIAAAPHRLLFFIGATNVLAAMTWWALWLAGAALPTPTLPAGWVHGLLMQYQVLPAFIFGFLLTVFPRWMGLESATRWHYLPVAFGILSGQALLLASLSTGSAMLMHLGAINTLAGWGAGALILLAWLRQDRFRTWHANACFAAITLGFIGWLCFIAWLHGGDIRLVMAANRIGTFGLLLPIYLTVAHRMFPFFARNVVLGYQDWRPLPVLAAMFALSLAHLLLELSNALAWLWLADLPLAAVAAYTLYRWWPRRAAPALLTVLFVGFAWMPIAMLLYATQSLWLLLGDAWILGRGPLHALSLGMFGSLLVAMVTRVTQGHSGRPLELGSVALFAFVGMQVLTVFRIVVELLPQPLPWLQAAAFGWLAVFLPWVLRSLWIVATPRADEGQDARVPRRPGRPGAAGKPG